MVKSYQIINEFKYFKPMQRQIPDADGVNFLQYQKHGHQTKNNKVDGYDN